MFNTILFDLDGTLLPMDQDIFMKSYFEQLITKVAHLGYRPQQLIDTVWQGTAAMVKNDGSCTNEEAFWRNFTQTYGEERLRDRPIFDDYYEVEFQNVAQVCGKNPAAAQAVATLKAEGYTLALATNPIFPATATLSRIRWAGLEPEDFQLVSTYETYTHAKPNPAYYQDILAALGKKPAECLMVGNDVQEDMVAAKLGMSVFLLTDCLINRDEKLDLSVYPQGGFPELLDYIHSQKR